jgi:hypothetical protein
MNVPKPHLAEEIQRLAAVLVATNPVGHGLLLIGGSRFRLLDQGPRVSQDLDYHWLGDLAAKQTEIMEVLRRKLLPDVKRRFDLDGSIALASGPDAESASVKTVAMAFYRLDRSGVRIEVPVDITTIPCLDRSCVRMAAGTVFATASDADMIESKVVALFHRTFLSQRDIVDLFLFQDALLPDSAERLRRKMAMLSIAPAALARRWAEIRKGRDFHAEAVDRIIDDQLDESAGNHLKSAGGGTMIVDAVVGILQDRLKIRGEAEP